MPDQLVQSNDAGRGDDDPTGGLHERASWESLPARLRAVYSKQVGPAERALLHSWAAFGATFATTRALTHILRWRSGGGGSGGIVIGGRHLHHYNLGILLLAGVGGVAVHGQESRRQHPVTAAAYGSGAALIVDELALLIDLSDVYWSDDGRASVDAAIGLIGVGGLILAAVPFWQGAGRELLRTRGTLADQVPASRGEVGRCVRSGRAGRRDPFSTSITPVAIARSGASSPAR